VSGRVSKVLCVLVGATSLVWLAACVNAERPAPPGAGSSVSYGPASPSVAVREQHDQSDVAFLQEAIALRDEATTLGRLVDSTSSRAPVRMMGRDIATAEQPNDETARDLLRRWQQPVTPATLSPDPVPPSMIRDLAAASGTDFDRKWADAVHLMLTDSKRVIATEEVAGVHPSAKAMAVQWSTQVRTQEKKLSDLRSGL
jgi:uncharacterized protein (DUF305 family)